MDERKSSQSGFKLGRARRRLASGDPVIVEDVDVVFTRIHGRDFRFVTTHARDPIQRKWRKGVFYEPRSWLRSRRIFRTAAPLSISVPMSATIRSMSPGSWRLPR